MTPGGGHDRMACIHGVAVRTWAGERAWWQGPRQSDITLDGIAAKAAFCEPPHGVRLPRCDPRGSAAQV